MKNFLLFIALVSFSFASAQITTNAGTFNKPAEGETAFEFQFYAKFRWYNYVY